MCRTNVAKGDIPKLAQVCLANRDFKERSKALLCAAQEGLKVVSLNISQGSRGECNELLNQPSGAPGLEHRADSEVHMDPLQSFSNDLGPRPGGVYPAQLCYGTSLTASNPPAYSDEMQNLGAYTAIDQGLVSTQEYSGSQWFLIGGE